MNEDGVGGCSIYYNAQKYECLDFSKDHFKDEDGEDMDEFYIVGAYKHIETGEIINVATTRLNANEDFDDIREM